MGSVSCRFTVFGGRFKNATCAATPEGDTSCKSLFLLEIYKRVGNSRVEKGDENCHIYMYLRRF